MRGVAGVFPRNTDLAPWAVAVIFAAFCAAAAFYIASHTGRSPSGPALISGEMIPTEPIQIPSRQRKAAREAVTAEAVPDPEIPATKPETPTPLPEAAGDRASLAESGQASWYDLSSKTASGEPMDAEALTAAHPSLPLGTEVRVANLDNGRAVVVRINDRGPFAKDRIIDLSRAAAEQLDMIDAGVARVSVMPIAGVVASND